MRRTLFAALAALALLVPAACAGSEPRLSHQEYEREMQAIARDMEATGRGIELLATAPSQDAFGQFVRDVSDLIGEAARRINGIHPPEEIDEPHRELAAALSEIAGILDRSADRAEDGDFFGAMSVLEEASDDLGEDVRGAIAEIRTAGYYIGDNDDWG
jgi:hypothetical protein